MPHLRDRPGAGTAVSASGGSTVGTLSSDMLRILGAKAQSGL
jgi:hypothetical protein